MFKWKKLLIILSMGLFCLNNQAVAKFMSVDPVGALQHINQGNVQGFNRYAYANNNPYKYTDPDGRIAETVWDAANVAMGVVSMGSNINSGNYGAATIDALGVVVDGAATALPFIPGGAGSAIKAVRGAESAISGVKLNKQLASEKQLAELASGKGTITHGKGTPRQLKQGDRLAKDHGGSAGDYQKVSSSSHKASDGAHIETHAYRNAGTGKIVEPKTIVKPDVKY